MKTQARIFNSNFNPTAQRNSNKILRKPLLGPLVKDYYIKQPSILRKVLRPMDNTWTATPASEAYRIKFLEQRRKRGKAPPKKIREKKTDTKKKKK